MKKLFITIILFIFNVMIYYPANAQSIRKNYNEMTSDEKAAYVDAVYLLHTGIITECLPLMRR